MKNLTLFTLVTLAWVSLAGCADTGRSSGRTPPRPPQQKPGPHLTQQSQTQAQIDQGLQRLLRQRNTIQDEMNTWRATRNTAGPRFGGELGNKEREIRSLLEDLETDSQALQRQPGLRQHSGATSQIQDYLRFVEKTRRELEGR
jgi:hypothetical protein